MDSVETRIFLDPSDFHFCIFSRLQGVKVVNPSRLPDKTHYTHLGMDNT